jgi:hypothetical protein
VCLELETAPGFLMPRRARGQFLRATIPTSPPGLRRGGLFIGATNVRARATRRQRRPVHKTASDFVVEVWVAKSWQQLARSEYEVAARRLFERASYKCPTDILIRLRHGSDVPIKMPANGLERVRER